MVRALLVASAGPARAERDRQQKCWPDRWVLQEADARVVVGRPILDCSGDHWGRERCADPPLPVGGDAGEDLTATDVAAPGPCVRDVYDPPPP